MRRVEEDEAALAQAAHGEGDVGATEIESGAARLGFARFLEHQTHAGAIEEGEVAETVEVAQAENVAIEGFCPVDIGDSQGDLAEMVEIEQHRASPSRCSNKPGFYLNSKCCHDKPF